MSGSGIRVAGVKATKSVLKLGDKALARARRKLEALVSSRKKQLLSPMKDLAKGVDALLAQVELLPGGVVPSSVVIAVNKLLVKAGKIASRAIQQKMNTQVEQSVKTHLRSHTEVLVRKGFGKMKASDMDAIAKQQVLMGARQKRVDGISLTQRLAKHDKALRVRVQKMMKQGYRGSAADLRKKISRAITDLEPGRTRIPGGSTSKQLYRMVQAEQGQALNQAATRMMKIQGVLFVYWRLDPNHKWYGGDEICEILASRTGDGVRVALKGLKIDPSSVNLEGLYLVDDVPDYPHPFCICHLVASVIQ